MKYRCYCGHLAARFPFIDRLWDMWLEVLDELCLVPRFVQETWSKLPRWGKPLFALSLVGLLVAYPILRITDYILERCHRA